MLEKFFFKMWHKKSLPAMAYLFLPLSALYYIFWWIRDLAYNRFIAANKLSCKVISVGNINLGGTGKTPFLLFLLDYLKSQGIGQILILSRGYKARLTGEVTDSGGFADEAMLLKLKNPDVVVLTGRKRYLNFKKYEKDHAMPKLVILDDGFQHRSIGRDTDIVMVDGKLLFGNGLLFPAGPLREPLSAVKKRADIIFAKDADSAGMLYLKNLFGKIPVFNLELKEIKICDLNGNTVDCERLKKTENVAFSGIGNPESFKETLEKYSVPALKFLVFNDHADYDKKDIEAIIAHKSQCYITTGKDGVKLKGLWKDTDNLFIVEPVYQISDAEWKSYLR